MKITYKSISLNVVFNKKELLEKDVIVFLHGFTGSISDWEFVKNKLPVKFTPIFIDLVGHGKSDSPTSIIYYTSEFQTQLLENIFKSLELKRVYVCGYSMGGRLALTYAMEYPNRLKGLILESTNFGIDKRNKRIERLRSDENLAEQLKKTSVEEFINYWIQTPIFSSLKNVEVEKFNELKKNKIINNNIIGLSNSLLGFSTGKMENYFKELKDFRIKTMLIVGENDKKFVKLNEKANLIIPNSELVIIKQSGHNVHFEKPKEFLKFLNKFLLNKRVSNAF